MSRISVSPDELETEAAHVKSQAAELQSTLNALRNRLANLTNVLQGQTQVKFDETFTNWNTSAQQMLESLDGLGGFLDTTAKTLRDTDTQLASGLGS